VQAGLWGVWVGCACIFLLACKQKYNLPAFCGLLCRASVL